MNLDRFIEDVLEVGGGELLASDLADQIERWCEVEGIEATARAQAVMLICITDVLKERGCSSRRLRRGGARRTVWINVRLRQGVAV